MELGRHELLEIVSSTRADIMKVVTERSNEKASAYGIEIQDVRIKRADLPEQNEKAVFARMQAERERQAKQYRAEGAEEAQKSDLKPKRIGKLSLPRPTKNRRASRWRGCQSVSNLCRCLPAGSKVFRVYPLNGSLQGRLQRRLDIGDESGLRILPLSQATLSFRKGTRSFRLWDQD